MKKEMEQRVGLIFIYQIIYFTVVTSLIKAIISMFVVVILGNLLHP